MRQERRFPGLVFPILLTSVLVQEEAHAHLVTTGLGPFYDGISHLFLSPDDLLAVVALALLAGLGGALYGRRVLFLLPLAWLLGGILGQLSFSVEITLPVLSTLTFLVTGLMVVTDRKIPEWLIIGLTGAIGLLHGFLNGTAMSQSGDGFLAILGVGLAIFVTVALAAAPVVSMKAPWTRIAVRVAGSWIVAIGMLMLGWAFRN